MPTRLFLGLALFFALTHTSWAQNPLDHELTQQRQRFEKETSRPGSAAAVVPLLGLSDLWDRVSDRQALLDTLTDAAKEQPQVSPLVRAEALWHKQLLLRHAGDEVAAQTAQRSLGLLSSFAILGPFDNDGRKGHSTVYPPETETVAPDLSQQYAGKHPALRLSWRLLPENTLDVDASVPLGAWMRPETEGTAFALTYVHSAQKQTVAVRIGASGAVKVFVNRGLAVLQSDVYRKIHLDQEAGLATLLPGWNRVLVKISSQNGQWSFLLRLTTPEGKPLWGLTHTATPPSENWTVPVAVAALAPKPQTLLAGLRAAVGQSKGLRPNQTKPATPQATERALRLADLGLFLQHVEPGDPEKHEAETILTEAASLSQAARNHRWLAWATTDDNKKRQFLEMGLACRATEPPSVGENCERARLWVDIGVLDEQAGRLEQAERAFSNAEGLCKELHTASLGLARVAQNQGLPSLAGKRLQALVSPLAPLEVLRAQADNLSRLGRSAEAEQVYKTVLEKQPDDSEAQRFLVSRRRAGGQIDEALALLKKSERQHPGSQWPLREQLELLEGAGRLEAALQLVMFSMTQFVGDADWFERRGRLQRKLQRTELAVASFRRALELKPQNPALREYLRTIDPTARSADDLQRKFAQNLDALLAVPRPKATEDDARVLLDQKVIRIHSNGLSEEYNQRVVEILNDSGAREYNEASVTFTPDTQSVQFKTAKVIKPSGEVIESVSQSETDASEPWYGLYYDLHALTVRFDGLGPGDIVVVEYIRSDVGRRNLFADYFGDVTYLQENIPVLQARYVLTLPAEDLRRRPLYFNRPRLPTGASLERQDEVVGQDHIIRFVAHNLPKIHDETGRPGYAELSAYVHVSTYKTWADVANWYKGLVAESLVSSPEITRIAQSVVAQIPQTDELGRIRALYNEVVRRTRYVGLEFGIHGYKPYKVAQVWERKFGDCKDKAALLHVMLKEVGIESSMVLARTTKGGDIDVEPASLSVFDHAIVYVPKYNLFLDGTAEFSGSMELPSMDQDTIVLVVSDPAPPHLGAGHLTRTPVLPSQQSDTRRELAVQLGETGQASVTERLTVSGQNASRFRDHFQNPSVQKERYEKDWNDSFPGSQVHMVEVPGVLDLERPVTLLGELSVPKWGRPPTDGTQRALSFRPLGREPFLLRAYARLSTRRYDLVLGYAWQNHDSVVVRLPPRFAVQRLPEASRLESPFGRFDLKFEQRAGNNGIEVVIQSELRIDRHRIAAQDYPAFREFLSLIDRALAQEILVGRE